ncbi:MAG: hypothetical protein WCH39_26425 [Schlesneria sp.]
MSEFFRGWRRTIGLGSLFASLVFTGAWMKSYVDHGMIFGSKGNRTSALAVPGTINISGYRLSVEWPGHVPQIDWHVTGFYADVKLLLAPAQKVDQPPTPASQTDCMVANFVTNRPPQAILDANMTDNISVMSAVYTDEADSNEKELIQASAGESSFVPNSVQHPRVGVSFDFDISDCNPDCCPSLSSDDEHDDMVESKLQFCGFRYLHGLGEDGSWECVIQIPHWFIVLPLGLLATVLLVGPRRKNSTVVTGTLPSFATVRSHGVEENHGLAGFFRGWRRKLGGLTLLTSLAVAGVWVRSGVVSDVVNFELEFGKQLLLASGKQGLACLHNRTQCDDGSGTHYRMITGPRHETMTFLPQESESDFDDVVMNILPTGASANLPNGVATERDEVFSSGGVSEIFGASGQPIASQEPQMQVPMTIVGLASPQPTDGTVQKIGLEFNIDLSDGSEARVTDWVGTSIQWGGFYISHGPMETHFVIPYGFVVIPLMLLSALLLFSRRKLNEKPLFHSVQV